MLAAAHPIVHVNAALNTLATLLLVLAWVFIKQRKEIAHRNTMFAALGVSAAFLGCYLYYHFGVQLTVRFTHEGPVRYVYYLILLTHVLLAMTVPFLALTAAWLGWQAMRSQPAAAAAGSPTGNHRARHRAIVRWAYPIWLYVSVTGVLVYLMLYHLYPSADIPAG